MCPQKNLKVPPPGLNPPPFHLPHAHLIEVQISWCIACVHVNGDVAHIGRMNMVDLDLGRLRVEEAPRGETSAIQMCSTPPKKSFGLFEYITHKQP